MIAEHALPASLGKPGALDRIIEYANDGSMILVRFVRHQEMCLGFGIDAAGGNGAGNHRHAHRHGLQNLVLRATGDRQRCDHQGRSADIGAHVGHRTGHRNAIELRQAAAISIAGIMSSVAAIVPGGVGIRELGAAGIALLIGVIPELAFAATALNWIAALLVLAAANSAITWHATRRKTDKTAL